MSARRVLSPLLLPSAAPAETGVMVDRDAMLIAYVELVRLRAALAFYQAPWDGRQARDAGALARQALEAGAPLVLPLAEMREAAWERRGLREVVRDVVATLREPRVVVHPAAGEEEASVDQEGGGTSG